MAYIMVHPGECVLEKNVNSAVGGGLLIALLPHFLLFSRSVVSDSL